MSDRGRSYPRDRRTQSSRPSQDRIARQSGRPYEGTPRDNSTTSSRESGNTGGTANGSRGTLTDSPALQDFLSRPAREDPRTPYTASYAYGVPDNPPNYPYNTPPGNGGYNYPPANPQNTNPYGNGQRDNAYNRPYSNPPADHQNNNIYNNNTANGSYNRPLYPPRNGGGYTNGESSTARSRDIYERDYDTPYGRSSNSGNNQNNTSNRSQNPYANSRR